MTLNQLTHRVCWTVAVTGLTMLAGCGSSGDRVETIPVTGTVTFEGKPVTTGDIMFAPVASGPPATGRIEADGTYVLKTYEDGDGAVLGQHEVTITAMDMPSGLPEDPASEPKMLVPAKYGNPKESGLKADVGGDDNVIDFPLK